MTSKVIQVSKKTSPLRVERHWIGNKIRDLEVYQIPLEHLYFNIENGRYADRMIKLRHEHPNENIDPRDDKWKTEIEKMLAGEHQDTAQHKSSFETLLADIETREQLRPGVVLADGGVIDGNRRLAALRRLRAKHSQFRTFDAVILPEDTTKEDRWRIEAGLQLGTNERLDYSPVNEMLKIREGIEMYREMIRQGAFTPGQSAVKLVARAIYGKSETQIQEMLSRLRLIDDYLASIEQEGAYHLVGEKRTSEDFLEANKILTAAENRQVDPQFLAKLKAVVFYLIDQEVMDNYELRNLYDALGGDPKKRGRKKPENMAALREFLAALPEPATIQQDLQQSHEPVVPKAPPAEKPGPEKPATEEKPNTQPKQRKGPPPPPKPPVDRTTVEAAAEVLKRKMETTGKTQSLRKTAAGARGSLQALEANLARLEVRDDLKGEERGAIVEALESMKTSVETCLNYLRPKRAKQAKADGRRKRRTKS